MVHRLRVVLAAVVMAAALALSFTGGASAATKPHSPKVSASTCSITVWREVKGPASNVGPNGSSFKVWLYALEDLNTGVYCFYLHSSEDWSVTAGCVSFGTSVIDGNTGQRFALAGTGTKCNTSGSIQSPFYHTTYFSSCWGGDGWINTFPTGEANAICFAG